MEISDELAMEISDRIMHDLDPLHELSFDELGIVVESMKQGKKVEVRRGRDDQPEVFISED